jgi:transposase InsO family protein
MQQQWLGYRVRGYERLRRYADRMHAISVTAAHRLMVLNFWAKHGLQAAVDAFGVSRRTLYNWRSAYKDSDGDTAALNNQSRAPKHLRQRLPWAEGVLAHLVSLRQQMPAIGFEKLHIFLADWCEPRGLSCPSVSTLRRAAKSDKRLMPVKHKASAATRMKPHGQRRPKGYAPKAPGECVGVDTIEIYGSGLYSGMRRYVATFKDMHSRFALAAALPTKHARHTAKLWQIARACYPFKPQRVLSDNGSEFKAQFTKIVLDDGAVRWLTYPKCPKMNAHAERFNRTIQEEFIEFHKDLLFEDIDAFNDKLLDYLIWFNESRPHYALGLRSPMQFLAEEHQCNMYWRDTNTCVTRRIRCILAGSADEDL